MPYLVSLERSTRCLTFEGRLGGWWGRQEQVLRTKSFGFGFKHEPGFGVFGFAGIQDFLQAWLSLSILQMKKLSGICLFVKQIGEGSVHLVRFFNPKLFLNFERSKLRCSCMVDRLIIRLNNDKNDSGIIILTCQWLMCQLNETEINNISSRTKIKTFDGLQQIHNSRTYEYLSF